MSDRPPERSVSEARSRAQRAVAWARDREAAGDTAAAQRGYETALSWYLRAGLSPGWCEGGAPRDLDVSDAAIPSGLRATRSVADGYPFVLHTDRRYPGPDTERWLAVHPDDLQSVER